MDSWIIDKYNTIQYKYRQVCDVLETVTWLYHVEAETIN